MEWLAGQLRLPSTHLPERREKHLEIIFTMGTGKKTNCVGGYVKGSNVFIQVLCDNNPPVSLITCLRYKLVFIVFNLKL